MPQRRLAMNCNCKQITHFLNNYKMSLHYTVHVFILISDAQQIEMRAITSKE